MSGLDENVLSHIKRVGYSMPEVYRATMQHINNEELSDDQLDVLADFKLAVEAYGSKLAVDGFDNFPNKELALFNDLFADLNLDKRIKTHTVLENPDSTKAQMVKTKFSTYYKVTNGTDNLFLADPEFREKVDGERRKKHYDYKIPFPAGNWLPATGIRLERWTADNHDRQFELLAPEPLKPISLPANGCAFFEKLDKGNK